MSGSNVFVNLRLDVRHGKTKPPRCAICHPRANPKPLCIDGAAYRRRTKGRKR